MVKLHDETHDFHGGTHDFHSKTFPGYILHGKPDTFLVKPNVPTAKLNIFMVELHGATSPVELHRWNFTVELYGGTCHSRMNFLLSYWNPITSMVALHDVTHNLHGETPGPSP